MCSTLTLVLVAVCCLLVLAGPAQGRKRVIIKVPYYIKHVHHHHVKKIHIDKYHRPKEYHIHHKPRFTKWSKKRPVYFEEHEYNNDHDFDDDYRKDWKNIAYKRPNKHYEEATEGSNHVAYKTETDWKHVREDNKDYKTSETNTREEVEKQKSSSEPYASALTQVVPHVAPQILVALPSNFVVPSLNYGIPPHLPHVPMHYPVPFKSQDVGKEQKMVYQEPMQYPVPFKSQEIEKEPKINYQEDIHYNPAPFKSQELEKDQQSSYQEINKPAYDLNKEIWEPSKPVWETTYNWRDSSKNAKKKKKKTAFSYAVNVLH